MRPKYRRIRAFSCDKYSRPTASQPQPPQIKRQAKGILAMSPDPSLTLCAILTKSLPLPLDLAALAAVPEDRWLSILTKCVFQAGSTGK